jgi:hypothetical protein
VLHHVRNAARVFSEIYLVCGKVNGCLVLAGGIDAVNVSTLLYVIDHTSHISELSSVPQFFVEFIQCDIHLSGENSPDSSRCMSLGGPNICELGGSPCADSRASLSIQCGFCLRSVAKCGKPTDLHD